ncbi:hypothetical protein GCM10011428_12670 [Streptomyces violaceus]
MRPGTRRVPGRIACVPHPVNRSLAPTETEMLRNLYREFRGNGRLSERYSGRARDDAATLMKNACRPVPGEVKTGPRSAVRDDCHGHRAPRDTAKARTVHQTSSQTSSEELVKAPGRRCHTRLRRRCASVELLTAHFEGVHGVVSPITCTPR